MIRNIIFDVGKVLVEWEPDVAMRKLGFDEDTVKAVSAATVETDDWNESDRSLLSDEEQLQVFIEKAPAYEKEIRLFWDNVGTAIWQYDYVKGWMQGLRDRGYHLYILSNYARRTYAQTRERALSFLEDVDGQMFSFEVHQIKPEPEIYQSLLEKFELKPEECVFLDDREDNIRGAEAAGIHGIQFAGYEAAKVKLEELLKME